MPASPSRWYVPGSLGVNTAFDEPTESPTPLSASWSNVGSAICHEGGETLNLLESGPADKGPRLSWWALNASTPRKAVRLASLSATFVSAQDGNSSGALSFSTKAATGDLVEALRITEAQALAIPKSVAIGPATVGPGVGRVESSGEAAGFSFMKRSLASWPTAPAAGDQFVWYNPDGSARLWTDAIGDVLTIRANGDALFAGAVIVPHVFHWYHHGLSADRTAWMGFGFGAADNSLTIANDIGPVNIKGRELLFLKNASGVVVSQEGGGTGHLWVQGSVFAQGALQVGNAGTPIRDLRVGSEAVGNSGRQVKSVTVGFAPAFSGSPRVVATVRGDGRRNLSDSFTVSITDVTPSDFAANVCRTDAMSGWGQLVTLDWIAWE